MTVGELYSAVAYLGFETGLRDEALRRGFYAALGRALTQVNLLRPRHRRVALCHVPPEAMPCAAAPLLHAAGTETRIALPEGTRGLVLALSGAGEVVLREGEAERRHTVSSSRETVIRERLSEKGELILRGETLCLHALGAYAALPAFGEVIPGRGVGYSMRTLEPEFLSFRHPALYLGGEAVEVGALFEGDRLRLPEGAPAGVYEVDLNLSMPSYSEGDSDESEIPLDADLASLLPELIASLIWLEDSPERAAYYASVYQRGCARIASRERESAGRVISQNGW